MEKNEVKEVKPIILKDNETGESYTLEFTRESVFYAQKFKDFNVDEISTKPMVAIPALFEYSFRAHHPNVSKTKIDALFAGMHGMPSGMLERLIELYYAPYTYLTKTDEDDEKNASVTVEL